MTMKKIYLIATVIAGATFLSACNSGYTRRNPGRIYTPDMVYSRAYNAFTENPVTPNGLTSQLPVPGTIARDKPLPKHMNASDLDGYAALQFPKKYNSQELAQGKQLFDIYCGICHGEKLDGQGPLFTSGKFASMPANLLSGDYYLHLKPGLVYHTIEYGKNMMGSYYSQLDEDQRWEVIAFIKKLQDEKLGVPFLYEIGADSVSVSAPASDSTKKAAGASADTSSGKNASAKK